jgi:putative DNA primase/helicase
MGDAIKTSPRFDNIPCDLRHLAHWVCWGIVLRNGKPTKMPMQPSGAPASSTDSKTWSSFERVCNTNGQFAGIGFVFTKEAGFAGIDLDKCRNPETGETEKWALAIIEQLDSYSEISQSGAGWHVIVKGNLPPGGNRRGRVEMYDHGRFFCMTGAWDGTGRLTIEARDLAGLQKRMLAGELEPKQTTAPKLKTDESAEDFRLIREVQK